MRSRCRPRRAAGDGYVLQGRKLWITNANEADLFIVFATVNPKRLQGHHRVSSSSAA
jgi:alkylation response protein AidB-like acyl-CoA dehydrogenase